MIQHKELFFIGQTSLAKIMKGIYDLSHVLQFLLEYLCTLSEKDFDAILIDYQDGDNPPEPTLSSEYKKFTKQIRRDMKYVLPTEQELIPEYVLPTEQELIPEY